MILDDFSVEIDGSLELIAGLCLSDLFLDSLKDCAYWTQAIFQNTVGF